MLLLTQKPLYFAGSYKIKLDATIANVSLFIFSDKKGLEKPIIIWHTFYLCFNDECWGVYLRTLFWAITGP